MEKPQQENVSWHEYQWRLCVSYRKLNQDIRPFTFPIPCCDDAVKYIGTEANYFIAVDMNSGYWQVVAEVEARDRLEFFNPDENIRRKVMPMGSFTSAPTFVAMMTEIQMEWYTLAKERVLKIFAPKIIVDDILLYGCSYKQLLDYFRNSPGCPETPPRYTKTEK